MSDMAASARPAEFAVDISPANTALLVIDMQNDFCAREGYVQRVLGMEVGQSSEVAGSINQLVEVARDNRVTVIWIKAAYDPHYIPDNMLSKLRQAGSTNEILCEEGSWGAEFFGVSPLDGELVITKHCYNAFFDTELDAVLQQQCVKTLVVTGVATNVCVDSTIRDGFMRGYNIVVPEECVGSPAVELHEAALLNIHLMFGTVCHSAALMNSWGS
ncbi:MAG: cysteine hydrolase [Gammaproteobacteria bacterium]|nr:cysteine hydrolase [Gammaproteobacteria bacterium]